MQVYRRVVGFKKLLPRLAPAIANVSEIPHWSPLRCMSYVKSAGWTSSIVPFHIGLEFVKLKKDVTMVAHWYWIRKLEVGQSYLVCLALSSQFAAKGVKDIPHKMATQCHDGCSSFWASMSNRRRDTRTLDKVATPLLRARAPNQATMEEERLMLHPLGKLVLASWRGARSCIGDHLCSQSSSSFRKQMGD